MFIDQISVFMENKKDAFPLLTRILADNGIDLVALSIADTADYGIMRAIVNDTPGAEKAPARRRLHGFHHPRAGRRCSRYPRRVVRCSEIFSRGDVSVEYLYSFVRHQGKTPL